METIRFALADIGGEATNYKHAFAIEKDLACQKVILQNTGINACDLHGDIRQVQVDNLRRADLYVAGFPCQPFSKAGKNKGCLDIRGTLFSECRSFIKKKAPRAFILENVSNLKKSPAHVAYHTTMMKQLRSIGGGKYQVFEQLMNTNEHGLPHCRERLYIVGLKKKYHENDGLPDFSFPPPIPVVPLRDLLDTQNRMPSTSVPSTQTGCARLMEAYECLLEKGLSPWDDYYVVDIGNSSSFSKPARKAEFPCITRSRGGARAYWLSALNRRVTVMELLRMQGIPPIKFKRVGVSDHQVGQMVPSATNCPAWAPVH
jgi:DNA (cytosine-5)-methyltransferase 1